MAGARRILSSPSLDDLPGESRAEQLDTPNLPNRQAAVTVLFAEREDAPSMLLIRRAAHTGNHRTEWAFPGGVAEAEDKDLLDTALRETKEELGVDPSYIEHWGGLPRVVTGTGYEVWPFTGRLHDDATITPEPREVDDYTFVPVSVLLDEANRRHITLVRRGHTRNWDAIAYEGRIIWGATARIINQTLAILYPKQSQ